MRKNELANRWIHSDQIVLRRLAIHEQEISEAAPDEKLEWLLKQNLLFGRFCEHEVRQLFKAVIEHVSAAQKASLLEELQPPYSWTRCLPTKKSGWSCTKNQQSRPADFTQFPTWVQRSVSFT